ncbi:MAG: branched-chain amino acid ABC transporter permease [Bacillota bacterium]|nr:branched-chain amino acid ABC transporter permease [Bacillota bacterium]
MKKLSLPIVLFIVAALALSLMAPRAAANRYQLLIYNLALIYIILTLGLNFPLGYCGQASMGHAALWGIGAYTVAILATRFHWSAYLTIPAAILVTLLCGLLLGLPTSRLKGRYLALATMAFGEITVLVLLNWAKVTGGPNGILGIPAPVILGYAFDNHQKMYYFTWVLAVLALLATMAVEHSKLGRAMKAVRENELAAEVLGVPTYRIKVLAFLLASVYAAVAGACYVYMQGYVDPMTFVQFESLRVITMLYIGGAGTVVGPILGAFLLTLLPEFMRGLKDYYMAIYGVGVVLLMIFMPAGLYGLAHKLKERFSESAYVRKTVSVPNGR